MGHSVPLPEHFYLCVLYGSGEQTVVGTLITGTEGQSQMRTSNSCLTREDQWTATLTVPTPENQRTVLPFNWKWGKD